MLGYEWGIGAVVSVGHDHRRSAPYIIHLLRQAPALLSLNDRCRPISFLYPAHSLIEPYIQKPGYGEKV